MSEQQPSYQSSPAQIGSIAADAIARAEREGITIYPVKLPSGRMTYGLHKVGTGAPQDVGRFKYETPALSWTVEIEIANILSKVICNDHRNIEWRFFNATAASHWDLPHKDIGNDGDQYLIKSCRKLRELIKQENETDNLRCERIELFEAEEPAAPLVPNTGSRKVLERSSADMKAVLAEAKHSKKELRPYRNRIATVVAYERQIAALNKKFDIPALEWRVGDYRDQIESLAVEIAVLPAFTQLGMAWKSSLIRPLFEMFYDFRPYLEELTLSLADDARMLGTASPLRVEAHIKESYSAPERHQQAEAYHAVAAE